MKKATVTYSAPPGDSKVVEMMGHTFFDGKGTEVVLDDHLIKKLEANKLFKVSGAQDYDETAEAEKRSKEAKASEEKDAKEKAMQQEQEGGKPGQPNQPQPGQPGGPGGPTEKDYPSKDDPKQPPPKETGKK